MRWNVLRNSCLGVLRLEHPLQRVAVGTVQELTLDIIGAGRARQPFSIGQVACGDRSRLKLDIGSRRGGRPEIDRDFVCEGVA